MQYIDSKPDFNRLLKVLWREGLPDRVPFFEIHGQLEDEVLHYIGQDETTTRGLSPTHTTPDEQEFKLRRHIHYMKTMGYDYCNIIPKFGFHHRAAHEKSSGRGYVSSKLFEIENREQYMSFDWPDMSKVDYSCLEQSKEWLPDGMKIVVHWEGPYISTLYLLGYEGMSYLLADDIELVKDVINLVGERILEYFSNCASYDSVGALLLADDMAYYGATFVAPEILRRYIFPWHKKIVEVCHGRNNPIILHACGRVEEIMEDIIDCGFDARHSFEDKITPVWEAKHKCGDRIALLGGFDLDKLCRMDVNGIREHTRFLIEKCAAGGGWALGSGNSIANYIPVENYVAMMEQGFESGKY